MLVSPCRFADNIPCLDTHSIAATDEALARSEALGLRLRSPKQAPSPTEASPAAGSGMSGHAGGPCEWCTTAFAPVCIAHGSLDRRQGTGRQGSRRQCQGWGQQQESGRWQRPWQALQRCSG